MVFRVLLLLGPLLTLVADGAGRVRRSHGGTSGASELLGGNAAEADAHLAGSHEADEDAGYRAFGRVVEKVTILGVLVMALLIVGLILSLFGVFESDVWDPPV